MGPSDTPVCEKPSSGSALAPSGLLEHCSAVLWPQAVAESPPHLHRTPALPRPLLGRRWCMRWTVPSAQSYPRKTARGH